MAEINELLEVLEQKFPTCTFSKRGKKIILHDGGYVDGLPAFDFNSETSDYECGLHREIAIVLLDWGYSQDWAEGNVIHITKIEGVDVRHGEKA